MATPTRPTTVPAWGGTTTPAPTSGEQSAGFAAFDKPPFQWVNWFWKYVSDWIGFIDGHGVPVILPTLEGALDDLAAGESAIVDESALGARWSTYDQGGPRSGTLAHGWDIAIAGEQVVLGNTASTDLYAYLRDDLEATGEVSTSVSGTAIRRVITDGTSVYVATDSTVEKYTLPGLTSGTTIFTPQGAGNQIQDLAFDGTHLYVVGGADIRTGHELVKITTAGTVVWEYAHGATIYSVATDGRRVYIGGSAGTNSATMRAILCSTGFDAAGDGGLGTDTTGQTWDLTAAGGQVALTRPRCLATDGRVLLVGQPTVNVLARSPATGALPVDSGGDGAVMALPSGFDDPIVVALDAGRFYVASDNTTNIRLFVIDRATRTIEYAHPLTATDVQGVASDGFCVWTDGGDETTGRLLRLPLGAPPTLIRRVTPSAAAYGHTLPYILGR